MQFVELVSPHKRMAIAKKVYELGAWRGTVSRYRVLIAQYRKGANVVWEITKPRAKVTSASGWETSATEAVVAAQMAILRNKAGE